MKNHSRSDGHGSQVKPDIIAYLRSRREELTALYGIPGIKIFGSHARRDAGLDNALGILVDLVLYEDLKSRIGARIRSEAIAI